ncbi:MAG TPA: FtsX-like permease family protein [Bdellovibrionota bacterium]|nr:FtsX-like permease family protein [Bdellovibrionota bacterium]
MSIVTFEPLYTTRRLIRSALRTLLFQRSVVLVCALSILLLSLFQWGEQHFMRLLVRWGGEIQFTAVLNDQTKSQEKLLKSLRELPFVNRVEFISPEKATELLQNPDLLKNLPSDSFPATVRLTSVPANYHPDEVRGFVELLRKRGEFSHVFYSSGWVKHFYFVSTAASKVIFLVGIALVVMMLLIMISVLRLAWDHHRQEIALLNLLGATPRSLLIPFFIEGCLIGVVSTVFAAGVFFLLFSLGNAYWGTTINWDSISIPLTMLSLKEWGFLAILAIGLCGVSGIIAAYQVFRSGERF